MTIWTDEKLGKLQELFLAGQTRLQIVDELSSIFETTFTYNSIDSKIRTLGLVRVKTQDFNNSAPKYNREIRLPLDDYLITCDYHSPYFSIEWHNRSLAVAEKFNIKKLIVIGDLLDFGFASFFYSDNKPSLDQEKDENIRLIQSLIQTFDEIYLLKGNHEDRLGRLTDAKLQARILLELWTKESWQTKFKYSIYDKLYIGDEWLLIHPKSYSQISGQVAKKLASKFHKNIINAHGHFLSYGYDVSGKYLAVDMGGMFDVEKIEYKCIKTTTHPEWNTGFGLIKDGHFYFFDKNTDWNFWLK